MKEKKQEVRFRFGEKLRAVRERKGLTLKETARRTGVSESLVSLIERDKVSPSLDTLICLAETLKIDLEYLFQDFKKNRKVSIVRADKRNVRIMDQIRYEELSRFSDSNDAYSIEALLLEIGPDQEKGDDIYGHPGKELGILLQGKGALSYGTEIYELEEGDTVSFTSDIPHILKNTGTETLKAIWIVSPPRLFT